VWRERVLANQALGGEGFSEARLQRVRDQLPDLGYDTETIDELGTRRSLLSGRKLLRSKCVQCHDLRTILARPRTAQNWRDTVERMANRATIVTGFTEEDKRQITSYLIAITPTLQNSVMERSKQLGKAAASAEAIKNVSQRVGQSSADFDVAAAQQVFNTKCSMCHSPDLALEKSFANTDELAQLVTRMISNGLVATTSELEQIILFLQQHHNLAAADSNGQEENVVAEASEVPEMPAIAVQSGCSGCHAIDTKLVGPAWADVAARYRDDPMALQKLSEAVRNGGAGNWAE